MPESGSYGSVGEPVGNHRLYPEVLSVAGLPAIAYEFVLIPNRRRSP